MFCLWHVLMSNSTTCCASVHFRVPLCVCVCPNLYPQAWSSHMLASGSRDKCILLRDVRLPDHFVDKLAGHRSEVCGLKVRQTDDRRPGLMVFASECLKGGARGATAASG